jgi:hypothetical protein
MATGGPFRPKHFCRVSMGVELAWGEGAVQRRVATIIVGIQNRGNESGTEHC